MLTDPKLRSQVDVLGDKFWRGICNPCKLPLDILDADAVERRFRDNDLNEIIAFANRLEVQKNLEIVGSSTGSVQHPSEPPLFIFGDDVLQNWQNS